MALLPSLPKQFYIYRDRNFLQKLGEIKVCVGDWPCAAGRPLPHRFRGLSGRFGVLQTRLVSTARVCTA